MTPTTVWLLTAALPLSPLAAPIMAVQAQTATVIKSVNPSGAATATTRATTTTATAAQDQIDPTWAKPPLVSSIITVQGGQVSCGADGDGGDIGTDERKNRADTIATGHLVTVDAIRRLDDALLWRKNNSRDQWTAADSSAVLRYEGVPLTVEGYFEIVKPQKTSAPTDGRKVGEATNCHSWAERDTDWHIALVASPSETEEQAVVIEPTPRTKRNHPGWTAAKARKLAVRHSPSDTRHEAEAVRVRVTGFLMFDPVHVDHIRGGCAKLHCSETTFYRATLWELHPVTRIEVQQGGHWVDLNTMN